MFKNQSSFLVRLISITIVVTLVFFTLEKTSALSLIYKRYQFLILFFFIVTLLLHTGYENSFKKGSKNFVRFYLLVSALKLFLFMIIILAYALADKANVLAFATNFLFLYFIYTAFEIIISYKKFGVNAS